MGGSSSRGSIADKAARLVAAADPIEIRGDAPRFVSRGGEKLDAALERFGVDVGGHRCLDAGASTGGFTDCLLQRGAAHVTAIDVGYGVLHERLRADPRVDVRERTNIRTLEASERYDTVVVDLSFIGLPLVAPVLAGAAERHLVALVKPQFEAGRREASKGRGVIRDPAVWRRVLGEVRTAFSDSGAAMIGVMRSPLLGADGNVEFLALFHPGGGPVVDDAALDSVVSDDPVSGR